jgi:glucan biosynthesis protein C
MTTKPLEHRHDIDTLRVFGCYLLFLFHVGMVFNPAPFFHVRNDESSLLFLIVCGFIGIWHMPLLFLLAGWSAAASLRSRGVGAFLRERGSKLAVPLVAGCILLVPVIKYLELRSGQDLNHRGLFVTTEVQESMRSVLPIDLPRAEPFDESFLEFLPTFFTEADRFSWSHLWFVAYLFTFTLVLLPVLAPLARRKPVSTRPSRIWVYVPILPLALIQLTLRERFPGPYNLYNDWASVSFYVTFLVSGFALAVAPGFEERLREEWRRVLALGLVATGVLLGAVLRLFESTPVVLVGSAVAGWCFVAALIGFARERVTRSHPRMRYLAESAFPIYVLHQPVIVLLGAGVVLLPLGIAPKFVLLLAGSVVVTLALYHFGVRPFRATRLLIGMKPLPRASFEETTASRIVPPVTRHRSEPGTARRA